MRTIALVFASSILMLLVSAPTALAAGETYGCHSYEIFAGDAETGVGISTDEGATYMSAAGIYAVNDGTPLLNDWLLSVWFYRESNGEPGLQRGDEICDDTNGGENESDAWCIC